MFFSRKKDKPALKDRPVLAIDFGTTSSVMAAIRNGIPQVIVNAEGETITPSIAVFDTVSNVWLAGRAAKIKSTVGSVSPISGIKRVLGCKCQKSIIRGSISKLPYIVVDSPNDDYSILIGDRKFRPEEMAAAIFRKIKTDAEAYLGCEVTKAVITVPSCANGNQRKATREAAEIAGLDVLRLINETNAAAIAYGVSRNIDETVAVYHLGGGAFDISILDIGEGTYHVLSTNGDTYLGGDDFDQRIVDWMDNEFNGQIRTGTIDIQRLKEAAEKAKCELSFIQKAKINIPSETSISNRLQGLDICLTRTKLEGLVGDLIDRTLALFSQAKVDANEMLRQSGRRLEINKVILVGGQTRMPLIKDRIRQFLGDVSPVVASYDSVAIGAAIIAGVLAGQIKDVLLLEATSLSLGIETADNIMTTIVPRNTTIPTSKSLIFSTTHDDQATLEVHILQGEQQYASDNDTLERLVFHGINPEPKGVPQIECTFDIEANGILKVSAKNLNTREKLEPRQRYLYI